MLQSLQIWLDPIWTQRPHFYSSGEVNYTELCAPVSVVHGHHIIRPDISLNDWILQLQVAAKRPLFDIFRRWMRMRTNGLSLSLPAGVFPLLTDYSLVY